jgi:membrane protease YdiL (CAAX protease family)
MPVLIFALVFIAALFTGAVLSYPLYVTIRLVFDVDFADTIILSTQLAGFVGSLLYLKYSDGLSLYNLGLRATTDNIKRDSFIMFGLGFLIVVLLGGSLYLVGVYNIHSQRDFVLTALPTLVVSAIATGIVVATFEETIFRGGLLRGLDRQSSAPLAVIITSLVYAWVHFIRFDVPPGPDNIDLFTAPVNFLNAYTVLFSTQKIDAFISLFILGLLLGMMRIKEKSIINCIALHAGLVAGIKIFRYLLEYQPGNPYPFLVSHHDYRLGFVATLWLFVATLIYYFFAYRGPKAGSS